jgi:hypothetical protein
MKRIGLLIALFAGFVIALPSMTAQDKKDPEKTEKKGEKTDKKDDAKKDETKDPEKKEPEKKEEKKKKATEKMPPHGQVIRTKILSVSGQSNREFTIELQEIDPKKVYDFNVWKAQQQNSLAQQQINIAKISPKDFNGRINATANYNRALANFQVDLAKRSTQLHTAKPLEVRAHEDAKIRTLFLPVQFNDEGFPKKWTEKEKKEFRGDTQIPGYPSEFDAIKSGQIIDLYLVKKAPPPKDAPKKKKASDDDPPPMVTATPEFILIVIISEGK